MEKQVKKVECESTESVQPFVKVKTTEIYFTD